MEVYARAVMIVESVTSSSFSMMTFELTESPMNNVFFRLLLFTGLPGGGLENAEAPGCGTQIEGDDRGEVTSIGEDKAAVSGEI